MELAVEAADAVVVQRTQHVGVERAHVGFLSAGGRNGIDMTSK